MLSNEIFALACRAYYDEQGFVVDASNGEFAHSPLTRKECNTGYYLLWEHHQHQGLLQSRDLDKCCFFSGDTLKWLSECDYFPEGYFELWDIYDRYKGKNSLKAAHTIHKEKDELGRSLFTLNNFSKVHDEKNDEGKSKHAVKSGRAGGTKVHDKKDELGRSLHNLKLHAQRDEFGRSVMAVKSMNAVNAQVWESLFDGFKGSASGVARHNKANGWDPAARVKVSSGG
jgi:hypothetical protein